MRWPICIFAILSAAYAADVCEVNTLVNGGYGAIDVVCSDKSDSAKSVNISRHGDRVNLRTERVKHMKKLLDKGYELKADGLFVRP